MGIQNRIVKRKRRLHRFEKNADFDFYKGENNLPTQNCATVGPHHTPEAATVEPLPPAPINVAQYSLSGGERVNNWKNDTITSLPRGSLKKNRNFLLK